MSNSFNRMHVKKAVKRDTQHATKPCRWGFLTETHYGSASPARVRGDRETVRGAARAAARVALVGTTMKRNYIGNRVESR